MYIMLFIMVILLFLPNFEGAAFMLIQFHLKYSLLFRIVCVDIFQEFSRTFLVGLDMFDRTHTSSTSDISSNALINDPFNWPPVAFDQPEDRARALVARLVGIGFQSSCFPAANQEAVVFANAVSSVATRLGAPESPAPAHGLGPHPPTVPSALSSNSTSDVPVEASNGVTTLAIATMNPSDDESLALGHRGVWRDGQNMSRWCSLRDDPDPHSSVLCTHSPGTVLARPHYSCCGVGRGETCTVWRGDALPHPWHSHRLVACSHAHSDFAGWRCDGAESSAAVGGGGVCLGADRPSARRHPRGQRYRCPEPGCDFDLCECCFAGGRGEPLPEPPSSRGAFAAAGLPVEGEELAQWPSRSLVALVERTGLSTSDIVEREDLVARAGQAADEVGDEKKAYEASKGTIPENKLQRHNTSYLHHVFLGLFSDSTQPSYNFCPFDNVDAGCHCTTPYFC